MLNQRVFSARLASCQCSTASPAMLNHQRAVSAWPAPLYARLIVHPLSINVPSMLGRRRPCNAWRRTINQVARHFRCCNPKTGCHNDRIGSDGSAIASVVQTENVIQPTRDNNAMNRSARNTGILIAKLSPRTRLSPSLCPKGKNHVQSFNLLSHVFHLFDLSIIDSSASSIGIDCVRHCG